MKKIIVIGAGFSGLSLAYELAKRNFQVELHEKSDRVGGMIQTHASEHGLIETAANGMMLSAGLQKWAQEIQFSLLSAQSTSKKRFIFRGRPRQWPLNTLESFFLFLKLLSHVLSFRKALPPKPRETIQAWGRSRWTQATVDYLISPGLQGIYAGRADQLSASLILGILFRKNRERYHGTVSGAQGMQDCIEALHRQLLKKGVVIHLNSKKDLSEVRDPVVIATSVAAASQLLEKSSLPLSQLLSQIETAPLVSVTTFWEKPPQKYRGFGCLIPALENRQTLGFLMNTMIFANRGPKHSETFILGGATHPEILTASDEELKDLILRERKDFLGEETPLVSYRVTRWPEGIPQYNVNLEKILNDIQLPPDIFLHGNYLGVLGLSKILERSIQLAEKIERTYA